MKQALRFGALAAIAAIAFAACSSGSTPSPAASASPEGSPAASTAPSESMGTLSGSLTIWHAYGSSGGNAEFKAFSRITEAIQKANPDLKLTILEVPFDQLYKKFETESAAGGGPDMYIAPNDSLGTEARGGFLVNLDGKIDTVVNDSTDVSVSGSKVDGTLYMVPESLKAVAMYYDTEKVATPPASTDDLMTAVKGGTKVGVISGPYFGWGLYYSFGGQVMDDNGKCVADQTPGVANAIQYVADLKAAGALVDADYNKVNDAFKNGQIDAIFNGNWTLGDYRAARPAVAVAPLPAGPNGDKAQPMVGVDGWYINTASKSQDLAIATAQEYVSQAAQEIYTDVAGHVPANKNVKVIDPLVQSFSDAINQGMARPQNKQMDNYWGAFDNAWKEVLDKGTPATQAVATACQTMNQANGIQ
jgi:arabinogalactan oligomer/maltooligosaccharide transport system substrate-binding protein